ncbi:MAG: PulJ/GspJ family protein [Bacillota bacterium]
MKKINNEQGFTLLEILIAVTITALIMGTVFLFLNQAFSIWERTDVGNEWDQQRRVFKTKFKEDLNNMFISPLYKGEQFISNYEGIEWLIIEDGQVKKVRYHINYGNIGVEDSYNQNSSNMGLVRATLDNITLDENEQENDIEMFNRLSDGLKFFSELDFSRVDFAVNFQFYDPVDEIWDYDGVWSYQEEGYLPSMVRVQINSPDPYQDVQQFIFEVYTGREYNYRVDIEDQSP